MHSTSPSVSVALACHNGGGYVEEQIRSILDQTVPVAQLVLADDASSDETVAIAERVILDYGTRAPELLVLRAESPHGVTGNFERALAASEGEFVALADQDDRWHTRKIETLLGAITSDPEILLAHSDARLVDEGGHDLGASLFQRLEVTESTLRELREGDAFGVLLRRNLVTGATVLLRRELIERATPFPRMWIHDEWLALIAAATGRLAPVSESLIDYRQHGSNQIGVAEPTFQAKAARVLMPRGDRNALLWQRSEILRDALVALGGAVKPDDIARAEGKAAFERARAAFPGHRLRRLAPVVRLGKTGDYAKYASQGATDILRDLIQPM